jgi:hypothetical protein
MDHVWNWFVYMMDELYLGRFASSIFITRLDRVLILVSIIFFVADFITNEFKCLIAGNFELSNLWFC